MRYIRVVIADRHPIVLQGLSSVLDAERDFRIVARCGDGESCIEAIRMFEPDIAVLDISLPAIAGLEILANSEMLATRLVFFTASVEDCERMMSALSGVHSVIPKDAEPKILVHALRQVAQDQRPFFPSSVEPSTSRQASVMSGNALAALTDRERQIVHLVSEGWSNKEIGRRLNIADGTIKVHLHHMFQKLDVHNRTALAALAISQNRKARPDGAPSTWPRAVNPPVRTAG